MLTRDELKSILESPYRRADWLRVLETLFHDNQTTLPVPQEITDISSPLVDGMVVLARWKNVPLVEITVSEKTDLRRCRVALNKLLSRQLQPGQTDAIIGVFHKPGMPEWRVTFARTSAVFDNAGKLSQSRTSSRRFTFILGHPNCRTALQRFWGLAESARESLSLARLEETFSVETLTKEFYNELFQWYLWALSDEGGVTFPNDTSTAKDDRENLNIKMIRLITRLLFVWFIKQKGLVPEKIFEERELKGILNDFDPQSLTDGNYYNAILQNLFFATLNATLLDQDGKPARRFAKNASHRDAPTLYRYSEMFAISEEEVVNELFGKVPYLNGGLFDCLDRNPRTDFSGREMRYDGFSRNPKKKDGHFVYRAFVPNRLFFSDDEKQPGLLKILKRYNFTIEENSSTDAVVSLDPELLGHVFENLLAAYNPETQETARNSTGSFYTPREIVDYIVDESLIHYLADKRIPGVDEGALRELFGTDGDGECVRFDAAQCAAIVEALQSVKILDPACGSGAFPMGCLLRMVDLIERLRGGACERYELKLQLIKECIHGIDIQPIAMLISKLRFFISLVSDQEINPADFECPEKNFGVKHLPCLETKFIAADSLMNMKLRQVEKASAGMLLSDDDPRLRKLFDELNVIREEHIQGGLSVYRLEKLIQADQEKRAQISEYLKFTQAKGVDRAKIHRLDELIQQQEDKLQEYPEKWVDPRRTLTQSTFEFADIPEQQELPLDPVDENAPARQRIQETIAYLKRQIEEEWKRGELPSGFEKAVQQITKWNPFDQNMVADFFDRQIMFGNREGFDLILGNPPYIQLQSNGGKLGERYKDQGYESFAKTGDIYCLFYERAWQLLKQNGHLCYITSNKWMRAGYGEPLRKFLAEKTTPKLLIDFSGQKIFESATVDTNILLFQKATPDKGHLALACKGQVGCRENLSVFVQQQATTCAFDTADAWVILSPIEQSIKAKIEAVGIPLKKWDVQIYRGVLTGCNEAFIITSEKREEILAACTTPDERQRTEELIRPILRGRDIKRYGYEWAGLYLIATFPSRHYDINQYPAVRDYLLSFGRERLEQTGKTYTVNGEKITARKKTNNNWFETQDTISYWEDFFSTKIIYPNMTSTMPFYLDEKNFVTNQKCFIVKGHHLGYLAAFFNSFLFKFCFKDSFPTLGSEGRELSKIFFDKIPVKDVTDEEDREYEELVRLAQAGGAASAEASALMDEKLFAHYGITSEEKTKMFDV